MKSCSVGIMSMPTSGRLTFNRPLGVDFDWENSSSILLCRRINRALARADQIEHPEGGVRADRVVADAEAGFGGTLNAFEIMKAFIGAGAAGVHFEDLSLQ
jgi:isocitrate lyase